MEIKVTPHLSPRAKARRLLNRLEDYVFDPETGQLAPHKRLARRLGKRGLDNTIVEPSQDQ